jgi:hypothetical protein
MKRTNGRFFAIAVVVAVAIVAVYLNYPPVDKHDAQATIGAVQKYRTEQINSSGVILADEKERAEEAAAYGEFLEQSAQLQSMSAELAGFSQLASRNQVEAKAQLDSLSKTLDSRSDVLAQKMILAISGLAAQPQLASFKNSLESMQQNLQSRNLGAKQLESMQQTLGSISRELGVHSLESRNLESRNLESRNLESRNLAEAKSNLEAASQALGSKQLESKQLESIHTQLGMAAAALGKTAQVESRVLESTVQQLGARLVEAKSIYQAKAELGAIASALEARNDLNAHTAALESIHADLAAQAATLESFALASMQSRLESRNLEARSLESMKTSLDSISRGLGSRTMESKSLESIHADLGSIQKNLDSRMNDLAQKFAFGARAEIAAIGRYLDSRTAIESRMQSRNLESRNLESRTVESRTLESRTLESRNLESRNLESRNLESRNLESRNLESFNKYLGSLSHSLESMNTLAARDRSDLGAKAEALQSRVLENKAD